MTEWYVYLEGAVPVRAILGRRDAVNALFEGEFRTTEAEKRRAVKFLEGGLCDLRTGLRVVGYEVAEEGKPGVTWVPDRTIVRVLGPGTEV